MTFRTELLVAPAATPLPPGARLLTIGSCFAGVLGQKLRGARLPVLENPFGTVLNPVSACRLVAVACGADDYDLSERAVERDGRWFSYDAPSAVSGPTPDALRHAMDQKLAEVREFVGTADALVLTLGTAWAWRLDGEVVANCHKQPQGIFQKSLLSVPQIVAAFAEMHSWLLRVNPKLRVILTVSPVRHPRETLEGSSVSKATLRLACHHLATLVRGAAYFPAYELLLDDLRDYRFFAADMLHPSPLAEEYIFGKFTAAWFDDAFTGARTAWAEIDRALAHRSANPTGEAHQQFLLALLDRLDALAGQGYAVGPEVEVLTAQLTRPRATSNRNTRPLPAAGPVVAATPVAAPVTAPVAAALPAPAAAPAIRPIKPIIRVVLPPAASVGPPAASVGPPTSTATPNPNSISAEAPASEVPNRPDASEASGEERQSRSRRGRRRGGRDERPGRATGPDAPLASTAPVANRLTPSAADALPVEPADDPEDTATNPLAAADGTGAKKRRGRRGGRRHKQRRDAEETPLEAFDQIRADEVAQAAEPGADAGVVAQSLVPVNQSVSAEEIALESALSMQIPAGAADNTPAVTTTERKPTRPVARPKTPGAGKKITLQKVKSAPQAPPPPSRTTVDVPPPPLAASPDAVANAAQSIKPGRPERPERARQTAPPATPTPSAAVAPVAVSTASVTPSPPADKPLPTMARTPGRAHAKRAVGTPVEQATAARVAKKAGVGALLAALGGSAPAEPVPAPVKSALAPTTPPAPEKAVAPAPAKAAGKAPVKASTKAPAKTVKAPAKTANPAKVSAKAPVKASTKAPAKTTTPAKATVAAKAPATPKVPKAPAPAKTAAPKPESTALSLPPELAPPATAKRPAKPRTPKTK